MNAEIPDFIANNPDSLKAYLAGQARAKDNLENPDKQQLPNPASTAGSLPESREPEATQTTTEVRKSELKSFDPDTGEKVVEHRSAEENTPTDEEKIIGSVAIKEIRKSVYGRGPGR